jgi:small subunit ribosomal protein S10e
VNISRHHYYYYVKTEGVKYLREALGITDEVIPITFKKVKKNYYGTEEREGNRKQFPK